MEDLEYEKHWHLDKRLNVGHILTTLFLIAAMFTAWNNQDRRITVLESKQDTTDQIQRDIRDELIRLNNKMDRFLEKK